MALPIDPFTNFVSNAPLADAPGSSDMLALVQGGITKRLPIGSIPGLTPIIIAPTTVITGSTYNVQPGDYYMPVRQNVAGVLTVTLPAGPAQGRTLIIKDSLGICSPTNIFTLNGNGKLIDGSATYTMVYPYESITLMYDGTEWGVN